MLTEGPCLAHYAKYKENIVTTDASTTGLGITLWQKQHDGNTKPIAFGSRYLNDTEKKFSIGELELLAVVWGLEKFRFYLYGKKVHLYTDHQALELIIKRNRCNKQHSARLTRWLDRLTHFDISIQHISGSNLKFTDYLSRNLVGGATPEANYEEEYVINVLTEHAELNVKYGPIFADQSEHTENRKTLHNHKTETQNERKENQSQTNRIFENKNNVNKIEQSKITTSGQSDISTLKTSLKSIIEINDEMDRENFYHWGATRKIMEIIRRRNNSPETRRLVDQRIALSRPGTLRRRYDHQSQRTIFAPSRPNKKSREEIVDIDAELMRRANRFGGGYQPLQEETENNPEEGEIKQEPEDTEEDSVIMHGDNLPIVNLSKYNTEGKEAKHIQINQIVGNLTANKEITEDNIKKAEFEFMLDLKTLISKTAIDPELTRVRTRMRREDRETAPDRYKPGFEKLSIRWGLVFVDDQIVVPIDLRRRLLDILHFGHSGRTKMETEAKIFWWPEKKNDIETKVKDCTACLASGKSLKYQLPKRHFGKLENLTEPELKLQFDFTGKLHNKNIHGDVQILIAVDRFSRWPTVKICKTSDTKEVIQFLLTKFYLYGIPEKMKSDKGGAFISKEYREFCKSRNIEIEYCAPRIHTRNGTVERAIQALKNLVIANMEDGENLTESVNRALRVMRFTVHTGLGKTPFELHHGRKPRTELTNIVKDGKTYLSDWSELSVLAPKRPKIPIYVGRDADGEITNHIVMARTKAGEKQTVEGTKSSKKKNSTEKKSRREQIPLPENEIQPKNRHCLRGLDGKYGRWDEILRDILNGK